MIITEEVVAHADCWSLAGPSTLHKCVDLEMEASTVTSTILTKQNTRGAFQTQLDTRQMFSMNDIIE
jgi:hypothetical protein